VGIATPHTICLREDGSFELEEVATGGIYVIGESLSLREPDEAGGDDGGFGLCDRRWRCSWRDGMAAIAIHEAAVRLGTKGGVASGISRRK